MAFGKTSLTLISLSAGGLLVLILLFLGGLSVKNAPAKPGIVENSNTITASYIGTQLKQIDKTHAILSFSYDLENNTGADYHLADVPDNIIMARLKPDGNLTQQEDLRLSSAVVVPAKQHVRIAIEEGYVFTWPSATDPGLDDKLKNFVRQKLQNISGFVLFDEADHWQAELPSGWAALAKN